jgi:hypothetical protein
MFVVGEDPPELTSPERHEPRVEDERGTGEPHYRNGLVVTYVVRRSDLFWMYFGARVAQITVLTPGLLLVLLALATLAQPKDPVGGATFFLASGIALLVAGAAYMFWGETRVSGTKNLVGRKVVLHIDENGVKGWPVAPYFDRSWSVVHRARSLRGVITLPFRPRIGNRLGYTREGWVAVPERALTSRQLKALRELLTAQGKL